MVPFIALIGSFAVLRLLGLAGIDTGRLRRAAGPAPGALGRDRARAAHDGRHVPAAIAAAA
ncbi:hypothetical protein [Nonomuraea sp. LPB2021202275-12-8]|uniref:hypothetical protein n=1 Tax=Nonomuraea sp. LPB2021202275-12-8 TaxID=3120159 RepID=UPI00300C7317